MKQKHSNLCPFFLGMLTMLLIVGMAVPAVAETVTKSIEVRSGIRVFVDDQELIPKDANGNQVEVFLYNGTTYLPARAISEAIGKPIQWDGTVQGVYIGKHSSDTPAAYLSQMDYFTTAGNCKWTFDKVTKDNLGNEHTHSVYSSSAPAYFNNNCSITYKLNGQYSRLTAMFYQLYNYRESNNYGATLIISGDGKQLWQGSMGPGIDPISIDVNITGVLELTLEYPGGGQRVGSRTALGEVALWS